MKRRLRFRYQPGSASFDTLDFRVQMKIGFFGNWRYVTTIFVHPGEEVVDKFNELVARYRDGFSHDSDVEL